MDYIYFFLPSVFTVTSIIIIIIILRFLKSCLSVILEHQINNFTQLWGYHIIFQAWPPFYE